MTHPIPILTTRRLGAATLIGLALLIISVSIFQPVSAQRQPAGLQPPFELIRTDKTGPLVSLPPLPLNAPVIVSETFDSTYASRSNGKISDTSKPWHQVDFSGAVETSFTWGYVPGTDRVLPITDTVWNAATNPPGSLGRLTPGTPYTVNMNSLLIYGPINFSDYGSIVVSATYFLDVLAEDSYGLAYSLDGTHFIAVSNEIGRDPNLNTRRTSFYSLPATARQRTVWLAFYFTSTDHFIDAKGVFIDEVVVRGVPLYKLYLPLVRRDPTPTPTSTPTPTATPKASYLHDYTFGIGSDTSDQNFVDWGKTVSSADCYYGSGGSSCNWGQGLQTGGNPDGSLMLYQNGLHSWAGASPNNLAPTDFEFSADIFVVEPKKDARFGLIFDASDSTFGRDGDVPYFDPNRNLYKFDLQFNETTETTISYYRLEACQNNIQACPHTGCQSGNSRRLRQQRRQLEQHPGTAAGQQH
jgi:hypothetical protein